MPNNSISLNAASILIVQNRIRAMIMN